MEVRNDRRWVLKLLGVGGVAVVASPWSLACTKKKTREKLETELDVAERLVAPWSVGAVVGSMKLESIRGVIWGAASLTFAGVGKKVQLDIARRDTSEGAPTPIASTEHYDLFVANNGDGNTTTGAEVEQLVEAVAARIRANENSLPRLTVLTLRQRVARHQNERLLLASGT